MLPMSMGYHTSYSSTVTSSNSLSHDDMSTSLTASSLLPLRPHTLHFQLLPLPLSTFLSILLWPMTSCFTSTDSSFSHSGTMKNRMPSIAPGSWTLFINRASRMTYGKSAVKYTTWTHTHTQICYRYVYAVLDTMSVRLLWQSSFSPYLAGGLDPLEDAEVDQDPGQQKKKEEFPSHCPSLIHSPGPL